MRMFFFTSLNKFAHNVGKMFVLLVEIIYWTFKKIPSIKDIFFQLQEAGVKTFPVIVLTSFTTGMVLALQLGLVMQRWLGYPVFVGMTVSFSVAKELGPILTSVVVAGRVGAAITAELGTMKVTEQIDAMYTLGSHPVQYLAVPRFLACVTMVPVLAFLSIVISVFGGLFVALTVLDIPASVYWHDIFDYMYINDLMHGLIKTVFFGVIIAWVSIFKGFECEIGAQGVGRATTSSVVLSMILILVSDYFLSTMLIALNIGAGGTFL